MMAKEYCRPGRGGAIGKEPRFTVLSKAKLPARPSNLAVMRPVALACLLALAIAVPARAQEPAPPRSYLLFIDDLHLEFRQTPRTRAVMQRAIKALARDGGLWSVATTGTSSLTVGPTRDVTVVNSSVSRILGNRLKASERLGPQAAPELRRRAALAYATAVEAIDRLATASNGAPITVFYVSDGYDTRTVPRPNEVIEAATRARAIIVAIRPGRIEWGSPAGAPSNEWTAYDAAAGEAMSALATETGGTAVLTREEMDAMFPGPRRLPAPPAQ